MDNDESKRAIKLLEKAIKDDYLNKSEVQEFYELFKKNKVGTFLVGGEMYTCNKKNAERLIKELKSCIGIVKHQIKMVDTTDRCIKFFTLVSSALGVPIALLELIGLIQGRELTQTTIKVASILFELIQSLLDLC